ncbi:MAG: hypothetical protein R3E79_34660 [Caldilineaceae bacterium]
MQKPTLRERVRYAFDKIIAKGMVVLVSLIFLIAIVVIFLISWFVYLSNIDPDVGLLDQFWDYLMLTLEPDAPDNHIWAFRLVTLLVVFIGILLVSTLVGAITASIEERLTQLRQGRSKVLEHDHTVILGWSEQIFTIIAELVVAQAHQPRSHIVVLGDLDKVEMETEIRAKVGKTGRTRVICRRGHPMEMTDLALVSIHTAKSIIILSPDDDDPDASAIKTLLAICNDPDRRLQPYHIVMHIQEPKNARVAKMVGRDEVEIVVTADFIARITAQTCRQIGLATVYMELFDFKDDDIYFLQELALVGKSYGEALLAYGDAAVIGLYAQGQLPQLNPPLETRIKADDMIILIAENRKSIHLLTGGKGPLPLLVDETLLQNGRTQRTAPEHTLILGWNHCVPHIINELDSYVAPGSTVMVVATMDAAEQILTQRCRHLKNQRITFRHGDTVDREFLETLPLAEYDQAVLVAYSDSLDVQHADARTLVTLIHMRDLIQQRGLQMSIVSEMLDIRNRNLVTVTQADDFVISDQLVSFFLAQVAEAKVLHAVFTELFDAEGMEIYLKPATDYVKAGAPVNFYTLVVAASRRQETAIGYRLQRDAHDPAKSYGVVLNPHKATQVTLSEADRLIVIAAN